MRQIPAADIRRGMVVQYQEQAPIAVANILPGLTGATLFDSTGLRSIHVPAKATVTYLHDAHASR